MEKNKSKRFTFQFRLTEAEREKLVELAKKAGLTVSEFVRVRILGEKKREALND